MDVDELLSLRINDKRIIKILKDFYDELGDIEVRLREYIATKAQNDLSLKILVDEYTNILNHLAVYLDLFGCEISA